MPPILDKTATVQQLGAQGTYVTHSGYPNGISLNLQPAGAELTMLADMQFAKAFRAYAPLSASGIVEQNRLVIDAIPYTVIGRQIFQSAVAGRHMQFAIERATP